MSNHVEKVNGVKVEEKQFIFRVANSEYKIQIEFFRNKDCLSKLFAYIVSWHKDYYGLAYRTTVSRVRTMNHRPYIDLSGVLLLKDRLYCERYGVANWSFID